MIRRLHLGNFKAFAETQEAPLRPLTLIYGPNSAGKSSLIHSLALAHHGLLTGDLDTQRTEIGGESIDLGGFRQYVHRRDTARQVEWGVDLATTGAKDQLAELLAPVNTVSLRLTIGLGFLGEQLTLFGEFAREQGRQVGVEMCVILADDKPLITMSARRDGRFRIDRLDQAHPVFRRFVRGVIENSTYYQNVGDAEMQAAEAAIDELLPTFDVRRRGLVPRISLPGSAHEELAQALLSPAASGDRIENVRRTVALAAPRMLRDLINGVSDLVQGELERFHYLGPLRSYPPRHLAFSPHQDPNWHAGGGASWDVLRREDAVREAVNLWLGAEDRLRTRYRIETRSLYSWEGLVPHIELKLDEFANEHVSRILASLRETGQGEDALFRLRETEPGTPDWDALVDELAEQGLLQDEATPVLSEHVVSSAPQEGTDVVLIDLRTDTVVTHRDV
ncbi:AAA family ATPase, partial [Candidatus Bipolaricaulota bacterium]|nr:AAA family ATPase [Candidatus Bipolaricaulota bacterium]